MTYDKEFLKWFAANYLVQEDIMKTSLHDVWQAARKDHYRIGEEVESITSNAPAQIRAVVDWSNGYLYELSSDDVRRIPAKSRIDEIAEEAEDKYRRGAVGAGSLTDIIKSAILKDREERGEK